MKGYKKEDIKFSFDEMLTRFKSDPEFRKQVARKDNKRAALALLMRFSEEGDLRWVQDVLSLNVPINGKFDEASALFIACDRGHTELVQYLLGRRASTDLRCMRGQTALIRATTKEHLEIMRLLLEHGAHANVQDDFGRTALHYACKNSSWKAAITLIESGTNVNICDKEGYSPIILVAEQGNLALVQELFNRGVQLADKKRQGAGALVRAVANQHEEIVRFLLDKDIDVNEQWNGLSPLHAALRSWNPPSDAESILPSNLESMLPPDLESISQVDLESILPKMQASFLENNLGSRPFNAKILALLLSHGADPLASNDEGWSPLNLAATIANTQVVELLLSIGIDANEISAPGTAPLESACKAGRLDVASLLLERGADIELKNQQGQTSLFYAVWSGNIELVQFLIGHGAEVNTIDKRGVTPLEVAVSHDEQEMVKILAEAGADVNAAVGENSNILEHASQVKAESVIQVLVDYGARFPEELDEAGHRKLLAQEEISKAAHAGDFRQALELLQSLDDPEAADSNAATILKAATATRDVSTIEQIMNHYPNVKMEDALTVAADRGDLELLNIFIGRNLAPDGKRSSISCGPALRASIRKGHLRAFELLREKSKDLVTDSELRQTLVVIAASESNVKAIKRLLDLGFGQDSGRLNDGGMGALRLAILDNNQKIINLMLHAGTLTHEDLGRQSNPLMVICAIGNDLDLAKKLAGRGADINATGRNGMTALMTAASRGHTEMANLLLFKGAKVNLMDDKGRTALDHAITQNRIDVKKRLKASGARSSQDDK
jgi:ankyrin repeat protein